MLITYEPVKFEISKNGYYIKTEMKVENVNGELRFMHRVIGEADCLEDGAVLTNRISFIIYMGILINKLNSSRNDFSVLLGDSNFLSTVLESTILNPLYNTDECKFTKISDN